MKETTITNAIRSYLTSLRKSGSPIWFYKVHGNQYQMAGVPDWHILLTGIPFYIEVKAPGRLPTPLQRHMMKQIALAGGRVGVVHSVNELKGLLHEN
jgi:hypothetical protein